MLTINVNGNTVDIQDVDTLPADNISADSSGFEGNLTTGIVTVQDALAEIDALELGGGGGLPDGNVVIFYGTTSNSTPTLIYIDGGSSPKFLPSDSVNLIEVSLLTMKTSNLEHSALIKTTIRAVRTSTITFYETERAELIDSNLTGIDFEIVDVGSAFAFLVTGLASTTIEWKIETKIKSLIYSALG